MEGYHDAALLSELDAQAWRWCCGAPARQLPSPCCSSGGRATSAHAGCSLLSAPRLSTRAIHRPYTPATPPPGTTASVPTASSVVCPLSTSRVTSASCTAFHPALTSRTVAEA